MLTYWSTFSAFTLSLFVLSSHDVGLIPVVLGVAYLAAVLLVVREVRLWKDLLNPLVLVVVSIAIRYGLPALLFALGADPEVEEYRLMHLQPIDWQLGHVLAIVGMLGIASGWLLVSGRPPPLQLLDLSFPRGTSFIAPIAMGLGIASLLGFVAFNYSGSLGHAIDEGSLRFIDVRSGSGKLFLLALILISSSVVLSSYLLLQRRWPLRTAFLPVAVSAICYFVLGGRARAAVAVVAALGVGWYFDRQRKGWWRPSIPRFLLRAGIAMAILLWFANLGTLYRGGFGLEAIGESFSLSGLSDYAELTIFKDIGHLHALAGAVHIGPRTLSGQTFEGVFAWPLHDVFNIPQVSSGVFIVQETMGFLGSRTWGFHASLMGDAYLNYGVLGVAGVAMLFGAAIKLLYVRFRTARVHVAVYVLVMTYALRILLESIEKWSELLVITGFAYLTLLAARLVFGTAPEDPASVGAIDPLGQARVGSPVPG